MSGRKLTLAQVKHECMWANINHTPVDINFDDLIFAFGFKRMDGLPLTLKMLITGCTEEMAQTQDVNSIHINIENWCKENKINYRYMIDRNIYRFGGYGI